nr:TonB-dependent receptor plug domain-containing protein [uncultured Carboxylicivirga sp.]
MMKKHHLIAVLFIFAFTQITFAQNTPKTKTKEEVLNMTMEEMSSLPLEELMQLMDIVGVSSLEELYDLLLNKNVVSASKKEESIFDSPLSTTVLSHDQIISSGATCIEEALRLVPGVIVREKTNGNYDVHIRGNDNLPSKNLMLYSENMNTLVMINGRPVFNYSHGGTLWETLPVSFEDIDRIEVVRGPSSALYGPNAVTGVINIITQTIDTNTPLLSGNISGGNLNTYLADLALRKKLNDKFSVGVTGNFETRDRNTDEILIYDRDGGQLSLDGENVTPGYYSLDQINRMKNGTQHIWPAYNVKDEVYDIYKSFPNPERSKYRYGVNGYIQYDANSKTSVNIMGGYQNSEVMTSTMGDVPTPYSTKLASTGYVDIRAKVHGFSFQANYNGGTIDYMSGNEGFELDNEQYTFLAEYSKTFKNLTIRPGVSYQSMSYDDSKHISQIGLGYLNQKQTINIAAGSLRLDYLPTERLRLVAALRAEKYNNPDDIYTSWQFISSYKLNDQNLLRAVYSRANQSAFLVNTYSNYTWNIVNMQSPRIMQFDGHTDNNLKTMDMFELGYRTRPHKSILIDVEAFYNRSKDFVSLVPESTSLAVFNPLEVALAPKDKPINPDINGIVNLSFTNQDLISKQIGASVSIDWVLSEKLLATGHVTYQQTKLDNYFPYTRNEVIGYQANIAQTDPNREALAGSAIYDYAIGVSSGTIDPIKQPYAIINTVTDKPSGIENNFKHEATPSVWGSVSLSYRPTKKWEIFPQAYFYGNQTFINQYGNVDIEQSLIVNAKASYKATDKLTFFINCRNLLNTEKIQFAYMDKIGGLYLAGINFKL